jgi:lysozyme family protein
LQHPFEVLAPEYSHLLSQMKITRLAVVDATAERLVGDIDAGHYDVGCKATGVPVPLAAASFEREASSNFRLNPAQGWPLDEKSKDVPYNGPFSDWTTAQIAAYKIDDLDQIGAANWSWERACYEEELFNGFGYRSHGVPSPYLFGGTNIQKPGKYTTDRGYDPNVMDTQLGVIPMMLRIVQMRPALALPFPFPAATTSPVVVPVPAPPPAGLQNAEMLQNALNELGADPKLAVDGNFGRQTKRALIAFQAANGLEADGLAGAKTWVVINAKIAMPK